MVKKYTEDVKLYRIKTKMNPAPGQFFQVSVLGIGECPLASCSYNNKYVDVIIRNAGRVTNAIFKLKKNDKIFIRGPYGKGYNLKDLEKKDILLIAGGTGIAPVASLADYIWQKTENFGKISIFFGFRDEKHILLEDRIKKWKKKFEVNLCLNTKSNSIKCNTGMLHEIIENNLNFSERLIAILCGPEPMMENVSKVLNKKGITENKIYWNMERRMECAFGSCGRCLIQDVYVCRDGPVFRYDFIKKRLENEESNA